MLLCNFFFSFSSIADFFSFFQRLWFACVRPEIAHHWWSKLNIFISFSLCIFYVGMTLILAFFLLLLQFRDCREEALRFLCIFLEKIGQKITPYSLDVKVRMGKHPPLFMLNHLFSLMLLRYFYSVYSFLLGDLPDDHKKWNGLLIIEYFFVNLLEKQREVDTDREKRRFLIWWFTPKSSRKSRLGLAEARNPEIRLGL